MSELANYSIETDHTVLLAFKDGRHLRVPISQLAHYLMPPDLAKVRAAIKLRKEFIRRHMPKVALVFVAGGLIALMITGGQVVANLISPPGPVPPPPDHSTIVRNQIVPTPATTTTPQPAVEGDATVAAATAKPKHKFTIRQLFTQGAAHSQAAPPIPTPQVVPSPAVTPNPVADNNEPQNSPAPEPTPQIPDQGQVLGSCTSPNPLDCTDDGSTLPVIP
jgi:hypothetical protein